MGKCLMCHIEVLESAEVCPLCQSVLERSQTDSGLYPDVRVHIKKLQFFQRLYFFFALAVETVLLYLNYSDFQGVHWSVVTGMVLLYGWIVLLMIGRDNLSYPARAIVLLISAIMGVIFVDVLTGFDGWSVDYFLPGGILLLNIGIVVAMIFNARNWQSYMMVEIFAILLSVPPIFLMQHSWVPSPSLKLAAGALSVFLFLGTLIIGGRRASSELKRRFHVR